mgnify:FL=1
MRGAGIFKNHFIVTIYILALAICVSTFFVSTNIKAAVSLNLDYENGAYLIRDFSDLENLSEYVYTGGSTSGKTFKLTNSIDMKSQSFIPIGTIYNGSPFYFDGTFDGQGYTILNLNIDTNSTYAAGDLGIFGYLNGTVKNLSICYGDIYLTTTDKSAGGIVGSMYGSAKVERCYNLGTKVYTYSGSRSFNIGGVIGYQDSSNCTVTQCYNLGKVDNNGRSTARAGGIVGSALGKISECFNNGTITSGSTSATLTYAGGITGQGGVIENCFNKGSVTAQAKSNKITDLNNYDKDGNGDSKLLYEGLGYTTSTPGLSDKRYYDIFVDDEINSMAGVKVEAYAGGLSGQTLNTIYNSYNIADITGGYSNIKYKVHYIIGKTAISSYYDADYYEITIDETVNFANPIANGCNFNYCYSNIVNKDSLNKPLYESKYYIVQKAVEIQKSNAVYDNDYSNYNYIRAVIDGKYNIFNCERYKFHAPYKNPHPTGTYSKTVTNDSDASYTQNVNTYFYCSPKAEGGAIIRDYGMQNCRVSISNSLTTTNRTITINFLYDRYDIIEVPAAPDKEDDLGFAEVIPFNNESTKLEERKRTQDYDGNKLSVTLNNNFVQKPQYCSSSSLTSVPTTFNSNIWATNSLINDGNPYLRCFYWKDSAESF